MGTDYRSKGQRVVVRCCYGACFGIGFVVTTVLLTAMFWLVWFYFGISVLQVSNCQRRAIVDYSSAVSSTSSPARHTLSEIPESSVNQISRFATATSSFPKNDPSLVLEKRKELYDRDSSSAKGDFADRQKLNRTLNLEPSSKNGSIYENRTRVSIDNWNKSLNPDDDHSQRRLISPSLTQKQSTSKVVISNVREGGSIDLPVSDSYERKIEIASKSQEGSRSETKHSKEINEKKDDDVGGQAIKPSDRDSTYPVPEFIRDRTSGQKDDQVKRRYDDRDIPKRYADKGGEEKFLKGDSRIFHDSKPPDQPSVTDGGRPNDKARNDRNFDSNERRGDVDKYDNKEDRYQDDKRKYDRDRDLPREDRYRDRVLEEDRYSRDNRRGDADRYHDNPPREYRPRDRSAYDYDYPGDRKRDSIDKLDDRELRESKIRDRYLAEDRRKDESVGRSQIRSDIIRDRIPIDDNIRHTNNPIKRDDDKTDDTYPRETRFRDVLPDDRYRDEGRDRTYDDRYKDYDKSVDDRYRYRDPVRDERDRSDHVTIRDDDRYRYRDRIEERYRPRNRDNVRDDERYIPRDRDIAKDDDRYRPSGRDSLGDEERYRPRDVDEEKYADRYRPRDVDEGKDKDRYRPRDVDGERADERYRPRDRDSVRDYERYRPSDRDIGKDDDKYKPRDREVVREDDKFKTRVRDDIGIDDRTIDRSGDTLPPKYDTKEDPYRFRGEEDRYRKAPSQSDRDYLMSSRSDYDFGSGRTRPSRQDYSTNDDRKYFNSESGTRDYSKPYFSDEINEPKRDVTSTRRDSVSEDRYRSVYRDEISDRKPSYNDRDRISPTKVIDDPYITRQRDDRYTSGNPKSQRRTSYQEDRGRSHVINPRYDYEDRSRSSPSSRDSMRREYYSRTSYDSNNNTKTGSDDDALDRRSYSSEEEEYERSDAKSGSRISSGSRYNGPYDKNRDDQYESYGSNTENRNRRRDRQSDYDIPSTRYREDYGRGDSRLPDRNTNLPDRNADNLDRYDRRDRDRRAGEEERYGRDRYDEDRNDERRLSRRPQNFNPSTDTNKDIDRDPSFSREDRDSGYSRFQPENNNKPSYQSSATYPRDASSSSSIRNSDVYIASTSTLSATRLPHDSDLMKRIPPVVSTIEKNRDTNLKQNEQHGRGTSDARDYGFDQPLSAKDVIEAALRHNGKPEHKSESVHYPVYDPRTSNLTSPDIIRPSERRGITITAKKRK